MYNLLANETAASLRTFFQNTLLSLAEDWWPRHVVNALTFQQQRRVEESRIESLDGLDLAALIRVLDQNWYEITNKVSLPREARNYVKEMQTIRNRWAHRSECCGWGGFSVLCRFANATPVFSPRRQNHYTGGNHLEFLAFAVKTG